MSWLSSTLLWNRSRKKRKTGLTRSVFNSFFFVRFFFPWLALQAKRSKKKNVSSYAHNIWQLHQLGKALTNLWNLMDTRIEDRRLFSHVIRLLSVSSSEVSDPGSLTQSILFQVTNNNNNNNYRNLEIKIIIVIVFFFFFFERRRKKWRDWIN